MHFSFSEKRCICFDELKSIRFDVTPGMMVTFLYRNQAHAGMGGAKALAVIPNYRDIFGMPKDHELLGFELDHATLNANQRGRMVLGVSPNMTAVIDTQLGTALLPFVDAMYLLIHINSMDRLIVNHVTQ
jgi:hypothetical protein